MIPLPPPSTLFPYTTLFRSDEVAELDVEGLVEMEPLLDLVDLRLRRRLAGEAHRRVPVRELEEDQEGDEDDREDDEGGPADPPDRKSTRLNSSHPSISYAVF